ncbi:MAG: hypothetical protein IKX25_06205 [Bacteroidales bacterium]|nr:hypothetical protein [Bacteroidales bacterium]
MGEYYYNEGGDDFSKPVGLALNDLYLSTSENVIKPTPENSPGNPQFIDVSFTEEDFLNSPAAAGIINSDTAAILFSEQGVMVDVRGYNLHNPNDTLVVQTMPVKTDPTYGHELHTYNIFLTSGQDKFGTEVEVTLPIHNGRGSLRNVLWLNEATGKWEEVFYTVANDGKSCTAYVDHFSLFSAEESSDKDLGQFYYDVKNYLDGSIFVEYDPSGNAPQAMKKVGVIDTDAFEKFLRRTTKNSEGVYKILSQGGGVPTGSEVTESMDMLGLGNDISSTILTVAGSMKKISGAVGNTLGTACTLLGWWILDQREKDMTLRGISPQKVEEENRWSHYWTKVGTIGTALSLIGASVAGATCSWACVIGFAASTVYTLNQDFINKECPYGQPITIEEGAYHEYMFFDNVGPLRKLGINSNVPLNGLGKGWAEAINAIREANPDAKSIDDVSEQIKQLYEEYVNYFWTDLPEEQKLVTWRTYLQKASIDICNYCNNLYARIPNPITWEDLFNTVPNLPSDNDEYVRLFNIVCRKAGVIALNNGGKMVPTHSIISENLFNSVSGEARFNENYILAQRKEYKHRAMEALMRHTNKIIYDIIEKDFHKRAMEARTKIRNEVLPTLNATLYFYAVDESLKKDETVLHSMYYGYDPVSKKNDPKLLCEMKFRGRRTPLFRAKNDTDAPYCLNLKTSYKEDKVGKSTVFHYLQYGAPDSVDIKAPNYNNLKDLVGYVQLAKAKPYEVPTDDGKPERGFRVPVTFKNDSFDLTQFNGIWVPLELKGKVTQDDYITMIVYLPEDNEFGIFEGELRYKSAKSRWTEIKYFSFDEKTKTISIDFQKNARKGQNMREGIARYTLKDNGNLMMRNSAGSWEFFRLTEEDVNTTNTIPIYKRDDSKLIPLGDTETY